MDKRD